MIHRQRTTIIADTITKGETIEEKIRRIKANGEAPTDGAPLIYTNYKDGVLPQYDIRTDKMEILMSVHDQKTRNTLSKVKTALEKPEINSETEVKGTTSESEK